MSLFHHSRPESEQAGSRTRQTRSDTSAAQRCRYVNATITVIYAEASTGGLTRVVAWRLHVALV